MSEFTAAGPVPARPSPESAILLRRSAFIRRSQEQAVPYGHSLRIARLLMYTFGFLARPPQGGSAAWVDYGGVRGRLVRGPDADPANGVLLWIHGGGFVSGCPRLEQSVAAAYAATARIPAFLPRFRRPPEHPFPAAADDLLDAYRSLLRQGFAAERIRVGGMSSGGALAIGLISDIGRFGLPMPAAALLVSPVVQLSTEAAHRRDAQQPDPCCSPDYIQRVVKAYAGNTPLSDPRLDHLAAGMRDWPPILLQVGGTECLVADAELFGAAMRAAGARCEVQVWPGQVHVFGFPSTVGPRKVPEVRAALDYGSRFLLDR